jgi:polysaccharide deacetylase 2 family uncharacterized protein YibQ
VDDLNTPLAAPAAKHRLALPISAPQVLAGALGLVLAAFVGWAAVVEDPLGGEPVGTASIKVRHSAKAPHGPPKAIPGPDNPSRYDGPSTAAAPADGKTITIIDGSSGKRQEIVLPGSPERRAVSGIDERLLESTRHGRIPKIGPTGTRPVEAYAGSAGAAQRASSGPRIALIVGGLGISAATTADALSRLPPAVTLAFVPHGANLDDLAERARGRGHEMLLQVTMEPFDYPDNDPGPQTLLTTLPSEQNLDRLNWQMSRFQGYVGIMNLMGARFSASEKALAPVLNDIAKRGLLFVDDGSSARSLAGQIAAANNMPFAKAAEVLDAMPTPNEIDRTLARLEEAARKNGVAVGTASALPVSIDRIVRWAKGAEARGVTLVPVSVAALKPRSS